MAASNENVPTSVDGDVSTLGIYAAEIPPEDNILDKDMNGLPSAAKIAAERTIVTPLSDLLPRGLIDAPRISFSLPDKKQSPRFIGCCQPASFSWRGCL